LTSFDLDPYRIVSPIRRNGSFSQNTTAPRTPMQPPWTRLHALWTHSLVTTDDLAAGVMLEAVDRDASLLLAPGEDAPTSSDAWVPFALRRGHPEAPVAEPAAARHLLVVRVFAADADRDEFRRWLDEEHCQLQVSLPGVHWYLGYEQIGTEHSFLNLWSIDDPAVVDSDAWSRIRDTPWWARVAHVSASSDRGVYRKVTAPGG
jgi:hypothetical protein